MSKLFIAAELLMNTATLSCWGITLVVVIKGAAGGQLVLPLAAMQTSPPTSEWTGRIAPGIT